MFVSSPGKMLQILSARRQKRQVVHQPYRSDGSLRKDKPSSLIPFLLFD
jgi:hypothetical protein